MLSEGDSAGSGSRISAAINKHCPNVKSTCIVNRSRRKIGHFNPDFVLSNPPYINKFELNRLDSNVKSYEPHLALEAGVDGLNLIRKLILKSKVLLKKRGKLIFEIGEKQVNKSKDLLLRNGFYINKICKDIYLKPRVIISTKL